MFRAQIMSALFAGFLLLSGSAMAATVDYTGTKYDVGTLHAGQSGTVSTNPVTLGASTTYYDMLSGYMAPNTEIIFTYAPVTKSLLSTGTQLYAYGSYDYTNAKGIYKVGSSSSTATGHNTTTTNTINAGNVLVLASANITSAHFGQTTVTNNSAFTAYFLSILESTKNFGNLVASYVVVSTVPLPASFVLFALALAALIAFGYRQKTSLRGPSTH